MTEIPTLSKQALKCLKHLQVCKKKDAPFQDLGDFETVMVNSLEKKDLIFAAKNNRGQKMYQITGRGEKAIDNHKPYKSSYDRLRMKSNRKASVSIDTSLIAAKIHQVRQLLDEIEELTGISVRDQSQAS